MWTCSYGYFHSGVSKGGSKTLCIDNNSQEFKKVHMLMVTIIRAYVINDDELVHNKDSFLRN